ncbi:hypothetical protein [Chryseobacterium sp. MFBS3-17]|nr:hypothetical protein [Chryseobacterium sp. MFBS3-17]MCC2591423.1 hypothetical protein [Chryseobacterium sp. MFBS3-17]
MLIILSSCTQFPGDTFPQTPRPVNSDAFSETQNQLLEITKPSATMMRFT